MADQADTTKAVKDLPTVLRDLAPANAYHRRGFLGGWSSTWTTSGGTWVVASSPILGQSAVTVNGPGGEWLIPRPDAETQIRRVVGLLRALDALPPAETPLPPTAAPRLMRERLVIGAIRHWRPLVIIGGPLLLGAYMAAVMYAVRSIVDLLAAGR